jgi:large subunit ribosomal protein L25
MRKDITIRTESRDSRGKNEARRLRARGLAPAVIYGSGNDPVAVAVDPKDVNHILRSTSGHNTIFDVDIQGQSAPVMIVDWQNDPIKGRLLHVDLKRIDLTRRIAVKVPVHTIGDPKGVKIQGGLHELVTREIEIECLPDDIPEHFSVEVGELMIGQSVRASDIPMAGSMKLVSPPDAVISHVIALRATEAAATEAEAAPATAEPELIKKGKKEEAGEEKKEEKKKK